MFGLNDFPNYQFKRERNRETKLILQMDLNNQETTRALRAWSNMSSCFCCMLLQFNNTVGARIPNIQIPNPFEFRTF